MKKLYIHGPQGSGKTTIANLIKKARGGTGIISNALKYRQDLTNRLTFLDLDKQTIIIDEVSGDVVDEVVMFIDGWAIGSKFGGLIIVACQELIHLPGDWTVHGIAGQKMENSNSF